MAGFDLPTTILQKRGRAGGVQIYKIRTTVTNFVSELAITSFIIPSIFITLTGRILVTVTEPSVLVALDLPDTNCTGYSQRRVIAFKSG